jgi:TP901 family phage tail tape measure protein
MGVVANLTVAVKAKVDDFEKAMNGLSKPLLRQGAQLESLGAKMTKGITLPLAAIGVAAAKAAIDFESSFAGVKKTVNATDKEFAVMAQGMRDMAKEMPVSVNELNRIGEAAGQLGIGKGDILEFTKVMAMLGATTNLTSDQAATSIAQIQNIFNASGQNTANFASALVALGNAGASTEAQIVEFAARLAGAGNQAGMSQAQVLGFSSAMANMGLNAELGGTAMSTVFSKMGVAVDMGGEKLAKFAEIASQAGRGVTDGAAFKDLFKSDAAEAVMRFVEGLGKAGQGGQNLTVILKDLGLKGSNVRDVLLRLAGGSDQLRKALELSKSAWDDNKALTTEYGERAKTTASQLQILWNKLNDVAIAIGQALLPAIQFLISAMDPLIAMLNSLAGWFAGLPGPAQAFAIALAAIAAAAGPVVYIAGTLISSWGAVAGMFAATSATATGVGAAMTGLIGPIMAVVAAIGALSFAVPKVVDAWRNAREAFAQGGVKAVIGELGRNEADDSASFFRDWRVGNKIGTNANPSDINLGAGDINLPNQQEQINDLMKQFSGLGDAGAKAGKKVKEAFSGFSGAFKDATQKAKEYMDDVDKVGGVTKLTKGQQQELNGVLKQAIDIYLALGKEAPLAWRKAQVAAQLAVEGSVIDPSQVKKFAPLGGAKALMSDLQKDVFDVPELLIPIKPDWTALAPTGEKTTTTLGIQGSPEFLPGPNAFAGFGKTLAQNIMGAITGGGDIGQAIGGTIGESLFGALGKKMTAGLSGLFGKGIGEALGSVIPGLGTLFGGMLGDLFGKAFNKIFKTESKHVNDLRDAWEDQIGTFEELAAKADEAGVSLQKYLKADTVEEYTAAIKELEDAFAAQDMRNEFVETQGGLEILGFTAQRAGIDLQAMFDAKNPEAFNAAMEEINKQLEAQQKRIEGLKQAGSGLADRLNAKGAGGNAAALAPIAMDVFGGVLAETGSMTQAMAAISPALDILLAKQKEIPAAAMESVRWLLEQRRVIVQNEGIIAALEADTNMLRGLGEAGRLTLGTFQLLTTDIVAQWDALMKKGVAHDQALAAMQPSLQAIWEAQKKYNFEVDASTQKLIDMGLKAGMIGPQFQDPAQQMVAALQEVSLTLQDILVQLGGVPRAAVDAANGMARGFGEMRIPPINIPIQVGGNDNRAFTPETEDRRGPPDTSGIGTPGAGDRLRHMAVGGIVRRPTAALIGEAGPEAVIPLNKAGGMGTNVIFQPGSIVVHGTADADFADRLASQIALGGRVKTRFQGALR